jgi:hypothetical protein
LDSSEPGVQDLYIANVPSETPCSGADEIGRPISIDPGETHVIANVPGFCPDFELKPPDEGVTDIYTARPPDEKAKTLLATIEAVKQFDTGSVKLEVFEEKKARQMMCQGACWLADSQIDEVKGNEVSGEQLADRFWGVFATSAGEKLAKMTPGSRKKAEDLVKKDIKEIVAATSFVAKRGVPG